MKAGARAVIINDGKILLIHRIKYGKEYWVLPGGAIEEGEIPKQALIREIKEETNFDIEIEKLLWEHTDTSYTPITKAYYFLIKSFKGKLEFIGPELDKMSSDNKYILEWIDLNKIKNILLYPEEIKKKLIKEFLVN